MESAKLFRTLPFQSLLGKVVKRADKNNVHKGKQHIGHPKFTRTCTQLATKYSIRAFYFPITSHNPSFRKVLLQKHALSILFVSQYYVVSIHEAILPLPAHDRLPLTSGKTGSSRIHTTNDLDFISCLYVDLYT